MVAQRLAHLLEKTDLTNISHIIDIGSRDLQQSIEFSNVFPEATIDAFEPVPTSYEICISVYNKLADRQKSKLNIHNLALSNTVGNIPFYPIDPILSSVPNIGASSMFKFVNGLNGSPFGQNLIQNEIIVKTSKLDNWCLENNISNIDIIWVDAQGAELLIFQGAEKILKNTRIIMTEVGLKAYYEGHTLKTDIDRFLDELGFKEVESSFELSVPGYEANTIYIRN